MSRYVKIGLAALVLFVVQVLFVAWLVSPGAPAADLVARSYTTGVYREQGGDKLVVASGGEVEVQSGATFDLQSGATTDFSSGIDLDGSTLTIDSDADTTLVASGDVISVTLGAATGKFNILTGTLAVGNGTPDITLNGEDAYVEGTFEVDGAARFDGVITANSTLNMSNNAISNVGAAGTDFGSDGSLTTAQTITVTAGGLVVSAGGATIAGDADVSGEVQAGTFVNFTAAALITATNGNPITATASYQPITATSEVTPTIETAGFSAGDVLTLINTSAQTINIADTGNQVLSAAAALGQYDVLVLWFDGTRWIEISRSDN